MEENGVPNTQEISDSQKPKKGMPKAIIVVFILLLLCVSALGVVNFFPEVIPAKMIYMMAEKQNITLFQNQVDQYMNDGFTKDALKVFDTPYTGNSELTFKYKLDKIQAAEVAQLKIINNILSASKLIINETADNKNEKAKVDYTLNVKGNDLIKIEAFADKKKIGIKIPVFYDKYIVLNADNMAPIFEKFGQPVQFKKIVTNADIMKVIKFDKKEAFTIMNEYGEYLLKQLKDSNFKFTKGAKLVTSEGNIGCNQVAIKLTATELKDISIKMLEKMQTDDRLLNLTAGNVINVMKLYEDAGYYGTEGIPSEFKDINTIKQKIKEGIDIMKKDTSDTDNKSEFVMTLSIDRKFVILERKIEAISKDVNSKTIGTMTLKIAGFKQLKSKGKETIFESLYDEQSNKARFTIDAVEAPKIQGQPTKTTVNIESAVNSAGTETKPFTCRIDIGNETVKDKSRNISANFDAKIVQYGTENLNVNGILTYGATRDPSAGKVDSNIGLDTNIKIPAMGSANNEVGFILGFVSKMKFGGTVELPSVNASNSLDINTATNQQLQEAMTQIQTAAQSFIMQNASLFAPAGV